MKGKKRIGRRRKGILYEYNWDGAETCERIKGFWKKYWRRWKKRELKKDIECRLSK